MATDLVCGMTVSGESDFRHDYRGKTYLFCSDYCVQQFRQDPERYLQQESDAPAGAAARYGCPMHPEVVQDLPGNCPKCGMTLKLLD